MGKNKLRRFEAVLDFDNFFQPTLEEQFPLKGKWREGYFKNNNPLVLELGCGKGEYSVGMASHFPDVNFVGIDIKGSRMFVGAEQALERNLLNVAFLRTKIDFITNYFEAGEVDEIWLTFSDPQPKKPRKRLTSSIFIERYRKILKPHGLVHLKTDSDLLFDFTKEEIIAHKYEPVFSSDDLYQSLLNEEMDAGMRDILQIKTHYEQLFTQRGAVIKYCKFRIN